MSPRPATPVLCIVIPCFNEEAVLPQLLDRLRAMDLDVPVKVLFVDDGSQDRTLELLTAACAQDERMACLGLSRNFGHQTAVTAGLRHAQGDLVVVLDADLQDPPELLPAFVAKWREGYDVVYGVRTNRKESLFFRIAYRVFYRLLDRSASIRIPKDSGDFALMDRKVVDVINSLPEQNRFVRGMRAWAGFRQTGLAYARPPRAAGETGYSLARLIRLALDGLVGFSPVPLRFAFWGGSAISLVGLILFLWLVTLELIGHAYVPPSWAFVITLLLLLGGLQLAILGVFGEYLGRILDEVRGRPHFVIADRAGWIKGSD